MSRITAYGPYAEVEVVNGRCVLRGHGLYQNKSVYLKLYIFTLFSNFQFRMLLLDVQPFHIAPLGQSMKIT